MGPHIDPPDSPLNLGHYVTEGYRAFSKMFLTAPTPSMTSQDHWLYRSSGVLLVCQHRMDSPWHCRHTTRRTMVLYAWLLGSEGGFDEWSTVCGYPNHRASPWTVTSWISCILSTKANQAPLTHLLLGDSPQASIRMFTVTLSKVSQNRVNSSLSSSHNMKAMVSRLSSSRPACLRRYGRSGSSILSIRSPLSIGLLQKQLYA